MITLGKNSTIHPTAIIDPDVTLIMGDNSFIGPLTNVSGCSVIKIGDHCKIHRLSFINVNSDVTIGHNCWIGERCIIDGTAQLDIGNNVGIGIGTSIWSHAAAGDRFSGCRIRASKSIKIGDHAWLMGSLVVQASDIASRVLIMPGSNVNKDLLIPNRIWSGNPIADVTDVMGGAPWNEVSIAQKRKRFELLLVTYEQDTGQNWHNNFVCVSSPGSLHDEQSDNVTYFNVDDCTYTKCGSDAEQRFIQWMLKHNKAKFIPVT
jgi:UDP-3-O-[3-hydroxymyristoyl] glucosamine N-acyltransferase